MEINNNKTISGNTSILLDSMRIIAALIVLCGHAIDIWVRSAHPINVAAGSYSHAAVIVFFVLSGYVIAYSTTNSNRGPKSYAKARLSRLSSILIPALLITAVIQLAVMAYNPEVYTHYSRGNDLIRYILAGTYLNEIWFLSSAPAINGPLWSLSFEFWYYAIFGVWFFGRRNLTSYLLVLSVCLIAGPKILLMMPIWILGVLSYKIPAMKINGNMAYVIAILLILTASIAMTHIPSYPFKLGAPPLYLANQFFTDWIIGLLVAVAYWIMPQQKNVSQSRKLFAKNIRKLADLTFPIYVLHYPILVGIRSFISFRPNDTNQLILVIIADLSTAILVGIVLEKNRSRWNKIFAYMVEKFSHILSQIRTIRNAFP